MRNNLGAMDSVEVLEAFRSGVVSPEAYAASIAERAKEHVFLNALQALDPDLLVRSAAEAVRSHPDGLIAGLPLAIKDNINTTEYPTTGGTPALMNNVPAQEAGVVTSLKSQGGVVGAKAGLHELAFGITSNNLATGAIRNPCSPDLIPGGSSGGTAAAVAAGIFPVGLGTDTGGSCRIPAALCGIVGFRPTTGRYCSSGVIPISHTRDTVGTLARSVRDVALIDDVLTDNSKPLPEVGMGSVTLGIPRDRFFDDLDPVVAAAVESLIGRLARAGADLVEIDIQAIWPHNDGFGFPVVFREVMADLPAYLERHAPKVSFDSLVKGIRSPDVANALNSQSGDGAMPESAYREAMELHGPRMREIYSSAFEEAGLDAIIFPTTPLPARPIGQDESVELNGKQESTFLTYIRNTDLGSNVGAPGISLPCPTDGSLPVGIELDALPGRDRQLLAIALAAEGVMAD